MGGNAGDEGGDVDAVFMVVGTVAFIPRGTIVSGVLAGVSVAATVGGGVRDPRGRILGYFLR